MKLSALLTNYLYQNKRLAIPKIGTFTIDAAVVVPDPEEKEFEDFLSQIQFKAGGVTQTDEATIQFIREQTGKIRPLAESDFESYVNDMILLLNIGKPVLLEGIGTILKTKTGALDFIPGLHGVEKVEIFPAEKPVEKQAEKKATSKPASKITKPKTSNVEAPQLKRGLLLAGAFAALVIVLGGGYWLYSSNGSEGNSKLDVAENNTTNLPIQAALTANNADTIQQSQTNSTTAAAVNTAPVAASPDTTVASEKQYKFILQATKKKHIADSNFAKVKIDYPNLFLEKSADETYKIYLYKKCKATDTTQIKKDLNYWYWGRKEIRVTIEQ